MSSSGTAQRRRSWGKAPHTHAGACAYLQRVVQRLPANGHSITTHVAAGPPSEAIHAVARDLGVDLIAMATHARAGLARLVLGSVADRTLQHLCLPLLLVHPPTIEHAPAHEAQGI